MMPVTHENVTHTIANGHGGTMPLPVVTSVLKSGERIESSAWVPTAADLEVLRGDNPFVSLVVVVSVSGHRSYSLKVGSMTIVPDEPIN